MQSCSNRTSLNVSNNFPSLYLRLDNFPKYYAKLVVLFCPPKISIVRVVRSTLLSKPTSSRFAKSQVGLKSF